VRSALKVARRERLRLFPTSKLDADLMPAQPTGERRAALSAAFAALPPRLRAVAVLRLYVGLSESETAAVVGRPLGTVKSQLNEARRRLAESRDQKEDPRDEATPRARSAVARRSRWSLVLVAVPA
jgi:DNA-directed RNA polymerase specialized sigma24 family protein